MRNSMTLIDNRNNNKYEYDIISGTRGPDVVDIRSFYKDSSMFTYDPGYTSTASCQSEITFIDGEKGELRYRGYLISDLVGKHSYLDVCYLLMTGTLPNPEESQKFDLEIRHRSFLHEGILKIFDAFPNHAHPMATLGSTVMALSTFYKEHINLKSEEDFTQMRRRIIAKMPTIAAMAYRNSIGVPAIYPDVDRYFTENFLYMLRAYPGGKMKKTLFGHEDIKQIEVDALDAIFTLHADHEQNASTTTVRSIASTGAHPYVAISGGIGALWGPAHGGANEKVIAQLKLIGDPKNVPAYIAKAKDKNDPFRLMGFGHRVYKNRDPRAQALKKLQDKLKDELNLDSKLLDIASAIESIALNDEYFIQRKLYPNIDFYSGVILTALKIPIEMFTPIFVIGRTVGWATQWSEFVQGKDIKIARPRQLYNGK